MKKGFLLGKRQSRAGLMEVLRTCPEKDVFLFLCAKENQSEV